MTLYNAPCFQLGLIIHSRYINLGYQVTEKDFVVIHRRVISDSDVKRGIVKTVKMLELAKVISRPRRLSVPHESEEHSPQIDSQVVMLSDRPTPDSRRSRGRRGSSTGARNAVSSGRLPYRPTFTDVGIQTGPSYVQDTGLANAHVQQGEDGMADVEDIQSCIRDVQQGEGATADVQDGLVASADVEPNMVDLVKMRSEYCDENIRPEEFLEDCEVATDFGQ